MPCQQTQGTGSARVIENMTDRVRSTAQTNTEVAGGSQMTALPVPAPTAINSATPDLQGGTRTTTVSVSVVAVHAPILTGKVSVGSRASILIMIIFIMIIETPIAVVGEKLRRPSTTLAELPTSTEITGATTTAEYFGTKIVALQEH